MNVPRDPAITASLIPTSTLRVTWQHVAMRIAGDLPILGVLVILGILALKGIANPQEFLIGVLSALGFKSWPQAVTTNKAAALLLFVCFGAAVQACVPARDAVNENTPTAEEQARVATYGTELQLCVRLSNSREESQACRARVAKEFGRDGGE